MGILTILLEEIIGESSLTHLEKPSLEDTVLVLTFLFLDDPACWIGLDFSRITFLAKAKN